MCAKQHLGSQPSDIAQQRQLPLGSSTAGMRDSAREQSNIRFWCEPGGHRLVFAGYRIVRRTHLWTDAGAPLLRKE